MTLFSNSVKKLFGEAAALLGGRTTGTLARVIYLLLVTRMLGPELYGLLAYAQSWYLLFLPITIIGLNVVVPREFGRHGREGAGSSVSAATTLILGATLLSSMICAGAAIIIEDDPQLRMVMVLFALALMGRAIWQALETLFASNECTKLILLPAVVVRLLEPPLALILLVLDGGIVHLAALHAACWITQSMAALVTAYKHKLLRSPSLNKKRLSSLLAAGLPLLLARFAGVQLEQGPILLYRWIGGDQLGQLSVLIQAITMLAVVPYSLQLSLLPAVTRRTIADPSHALSVGRFLVGSSLVGATALALIARPIAPYLIVPILGEAYRPAAETAWLSLLLFGYLSTAISLNQQLIAQGRTWTVFATVFAGTVTQICTFLILKPQAPVEAIWAAGTGFLVWAHIAAFKSGLASSIIKGSSIIGLAFLISYLINNILLGSLVGLVALVILTRTLQIISFPRSSIHTKNSKV